MLLNEDSHELHTTCWACEHPAAGRLWYEDNGTKWKDLCTRHFAVFSSRLLLSGRSRESVETKVVTQTLMYYANNM